MTCTLFIDGYKLELEEILTTTYGKDYDIQDIINDIMNNSLPETFPLNRKFCYIFVIKTAESMEIEDFSLYRYYDYYHINDNKYNASDLYKFLHGRNTIYIDHYEAGTEGYFPVKQRDSMVSHHTPCAWAVCARKRVLLCPGISNIFNMFLKLFIMKGGLYEWGSYEHC